MNGERFFEARGRRYKLLRVSAELLMNVLLSPARRGAVVEWVTVEGLPDGVQIEAVVWDDLYRTFTLRLWHESFELVPPGEMAPFIDPALTRWQVRVPKTVLDSAWSGAVEESQ